MRGQGGEDNERARLWALYFGLRGLDEPPPFLRRAELELRDYLSAGGPPEPIPLRRLRHLRQLK